MAMSTWQKYDGNDRALIKKAATTFISKVTEEKKGKIDQQRLKISKSYLK